MTLPRVFGFLLLMITAGPVCAQADPASTYTIGQDRFSAGALVDTDGAGPLDDVFLAGATVDLSTPVTGDALLLGSTVTVSAGIGGDVYGAGALIDIDAEVGGDATLTGQTVRLNAPINGDVRIGAASITINAPIRGNALLGGETVTLNSVITGDVTVGAGELIYGDNARIDGTLTLHTDEPDVPASVTDKVTYTEGKFEDAPDSSALGFLLSVVIRAAIVAGIIMAVNVTLPQRFAAWEMRIVDHPERALGDGFLTMAMLIGALLLLAITVVGLVATPVVAVLIAVGWFMGYIFGGYGVAALIWDRLKQPLPQTVWGAGMMGAAGAAVMMLLAKIPYGGWFIVVMVVLTGIGAVMSSRIDRLRGRG